MMINEKYLEYDSRLREEFLELLGDESLSDDELVNGLLDCVKDSFILLAKEDLSCKDCVNCHVNIGITNVPYYCKYYQRPLNHLHMMANDCNHYFGVKQEVRKGMAKMRFELTGEGYYDG